ncbi:putative amino acid permease YhdG [Novipirellula galeiformis]|uniref:Putative amino acid permease YhdG n=1 Tax=Novipirellula galeiformis TaxID=2528004 RepID=A0A5C6CM18_9BACT|nr:putative amino acid permease YhdG [Novipirellula galeiformis]
MAEPSHSSPKLKRDVGIFGATMMGLGSILGTGIFVSIGVAAGVAGPAVLLAIAIAALVAIANGLSSAQLAANHPLSGGTYEYGYRWLHPRLGFTAGWMFLCAKSASAATAALGFAGYALNTLGGDTSRWIVPLAVGMVLVLTLLVLTGIRRSNQANIVIVAATLLSLVAFVIAGLPIAMGAGISHWRPFFISNVTNGNSSIAGLLEACALMFVAYTGYGRIATLGEEIHDPKRSIPIAIIITLALSMVCYGSVGFVAIGSSGAETLSAATQRQAAPLEVIARGFSLPAIAPLVAIGAVTAMLGVLLNLILGLSRVAYAMGRRGDLPAGLARVSPSASTPYVSVLCVGGIIAGLTLIGNVKTTWSFSAFTVLIYYAITNLAATRLSSDERLYPRFIPWIGLVACVFLAFWVEPLIWMIGLALIAIGLVWQQMSSRFV